MLSGLDLLSTVMLAVLYLCYPGFISSLQFACCLIFMLSGLHLFFTVCLLSYIYVIPASPLLYSYACCLICIYVILAWALLDSYACSLVFMLSWLHLFSTVILASHSRRFDLMLYIKFNCKQKSYPGFTSSRLLYLLFYTLVCWFDLFSSLIIAVWYLCYPGFSSYLKLRYLSSLYAIPASPLLYSYSCCLIFMLFRLHIFFTVMLAVLYLCNPGLSFTRQLCLQSCIYVILASPLLYSYSRLTQ
jgi:hypothetical protein